MTLSLLMKVTIMDLGLNEFRLNLLGTLKHKAFDEKNIALF